VSHNALKCGRNKQLPVSSVVFKKTTPFHCLEGVLINFSFNEQTEIINQYFCKHALLIVAVVSIARNDCLNKPLSTH